MKESKKIPSLSQVEYRLIMCGLLQWRNALLEQGKPTDAMMSFGLR